MSGRDICCQLCGVPTNIGRYRTPDEDFSLSWAADVGHMNTNQSAPDCDSCFMLDAKDSNEVLDEKEFEDAVVIKDEDDDMIQVGHRDEYLPSDDDTGAADPWEYDSDMDMSEEDDDCSQGSAEEPSTSQESHDNSAYEQFKAHINDGLLGVVPYKRAALRPKEWTNEHIASEKCKATAPYNGHSIPANDMRGMMTMQLFIPKDSWWLPEADDESFETDAKFPYYLSGLRDFLPRAGSAEDAFTTIPLRQIGKRPAPQNFVSPGDLKEGFDPSMPFHPACLEVFKRASLKRHGFVDMEGLLAWFRIESTQQHFESFPRHRYVKKARGERWNHIRGTEMLSANPFFVPDLRMLVNYENEFANGVRYDEKDAQMSEHRSDAAGEVPDELLKYLKKKDISVAPEDLPAYADDFYHKQVLRCMEWLWEAWCDAPYSSWATETSNEIYRRWLAPVSRTRQIELDLLHLDAKATPTLAEIALKDSLEAEYGQLKLSRQMARHIKPDRLGKDVDWVNIYQRVKEMTKDSPGLRNRRRIWQECNVILDRIGKHRAKGRIVSGSMPAWKDLYGEDMGPVYSDVEDGDEEMVASDASGDEMT